jgi:hypothetical protein
VSERETSGRTSNIRIEPREEREFVRYVPLGPSRKLLDVGSAPWSSGESVLDLKEKLRALEAIETRGRPSKPLGKSVSPSADVSIGSEPAVGNPGDDEVPTEIGDIIVSLLLALRRERQAREAVQNHVDALRENQLTWGEIGRLFGVTPQAAQQRFGKKKVQAKVNTP